MKNELNSYFSSNKPKKFSPEIQQLFQPFRLKLPNDFNKAKSLYNHMKKATKKNIEPVLFEKLPQRSDEEIRHYISSSNKKPEALAKIKKSLYPHNEVLISALPHEIKGLYVRCNLEGIQSAQKLHNDYQTKFGLTLPLFTYCPTTAKLKPIASLENLSEQITQLAQTMPSPKAYKQTDYPDIPFYDAVASLSKTWINNDQSVNEMTKINDLAFHYAIINSQLNLTFDSSTNNATIKYFRHIQKNIPNKQLQKLANKFLFELYKNYIEDERLNFEDLNNSLHINTLLHIFQHSTTSNNKATLLFIIYAILENNPENDPKDSINPNGLMNALINFIDSTEVNNSMEFIPNIIKLIIKKLRPTVSDDNLLNITNTLLKNHNSLKSPEIDEILNDLLSKESIQKNMSVSNLISFFQTQNGNHNCPVIFMEALCDTPKKLPELIDHLDSLLTSDHDYLSLYLKVTNCQAFTEKIPSFIETLINRLFTEPNNPKAYIDHTKYRIANIINNLTQIKKFQAYFEQHYIDTLIQDVCNDTESSSLSLSALVNLRRSDACHFSVKQALKNKDLPPENTSDDINSLYFLRDYL
jgi:hypothetical protein